MSPRPSVHEIASHPDFQSGLRDVLGGLRLATASLIEAAPKKVSRPTDLQRLLNVRASLAWQVHRLASSEDTLAAVVHVPYTESMTKVLAAARAAKFPVRKIERVAQAFEVFEKFVAQHAESRPAFEAMVAGLDESSIAQVDLKTRRAAFRANAHLWGFQATTVYLCGIYGVVPVGDGPVQSYSIRGSFNLRCLRQVRPVPVCRSTVLSVADHTVGQANIGVEAPRVLRDFSSQDLPAIEATQAGPNAHNYMALPGIGLTSGLDVVMATRVVDRISSGEPLGISSLLHTPCEELVADLVLPAGACDPTRLHANVCGCVENVREAQTGRPEYRLPGTLDLKHLGQDVEALYDASLPRSPELVRAVLREGGWSRDRFELFRLRLRYPILHTCIELEVDRSKSDLRD